MAPYGDAQPVLGCKKHTRCGYPLGYRAPEGPRCREHLFGLHFSGRREPTRGGGAVGRVSAGPAGGCGLVGAGNPSLSLGAEPTLGPATVTQVRSTAEAAREVTGARS